MHVIVKFGLTRRLILTNLISLIKDTDLNRLILEEDNVNKAVGNISFTFLQQICECIPEKSPVVLPRGKPWFNSVLCEQIRIRIRTRF